MIEKELTYSGLGITPAEIYEQMGYGNAVPDADVRRETDLVLAEIEPILRPRFCVFISDAILDPGLTHLEAMGRDLEIGRIIGAQLSGSQRFAFFVATAGMEFEQYQHRLAEKHDIVRDFIANSIGSVLAEKTADRMEYELQRMLDPYGWRHTNRFSPGYCGWHVSQQQLLFPMFPVEKPCGVSLTDSSLMLPIKSVSGVIGLGPDVRKLEYSCGLCSYANCYKRKKPSKHHKE